MFSLDSYKTGILVRTCFCSQALDLLYIHNSNCILLLVHITVELYIKICGHMHAICARNQASHANVHEIKQPSSSLVWRHKQRQRLALPETSSIHSVRC